MSRYAPLQPKIAAPSPKAVRPPVETAGHAGQARSFDDLERAARRGHHLEDIATHAPARPGGAPAGLGAGVTGLPPSLRAGLRDLSGLSMDHVRVHHDSPMPARVRAHAYTQDAEIHLAPRQGAHLAHEAWHAVQQRQGRVKPTLRENGAVINDAPVLEAEADRMGRALHARRAGLGGGEPSGPRAAAGPAPSAHAPVQRVVIEDEKHGGFYDDGDPDARRYETKVEAAAAARRRGELAGMAGSGLAAAGRANLRRTRFAVAPGTDEKHAGYIQQAFSGNSGSASHDRVTREIGDDLLAGMMRNALYRGAVDASRPPTEPLPQNAAHDLGMAKLNIGVNQAVSPHYNPTTNSISLMMPERLDQTGHETQHAHDQIHGTLDLHDPRHRIASELNAHQQQSRVSREVTGGDPANWEGRSALQMARSYEGKEAKGYPGTLEESQRAVREHPRLFLWPL
jgi:hypothetical protein